MSDSEWLEMALALIVQFDQHAIDRALQVLAAHLAEAGHSAEEIGRRLAKVMSEIDPDHARRLH